MLRKRREDDHIERLETVGCVRGKHRQEDAIGVAKLYKFARYVAAMAVKEEEAVIATRDVLRTAMKDVLKPR